MYSGGALTTRSDQSCWSLPRHTNCGSRSGLRAAFSSSSPLLPRGYFTLTGAWSAFCITDWYSAVGMFLRLALPWRSAVTVLGVVGFLAIVVLDRKSTRLNSSH